MTPPRKPTFAERVRAGTFKPASPDSTPAASASVESLTETEAGEVPPIAKPAKPARTPGPVVDLPPLDTEQLQATAQQILEELRRLREQPYTEFSVSKLLAGIVQVMVLPACFFAYLHRDSYEQVVPLLLVALFLETLTIALLIMGKQR